LAAKRKQPARPSIPPAKAAWASAREPSQVALFNDMLMLADALELTVVHKTVAEPL